MRETKPLNYRVDDAITEAYEKMLGVEDLVEEVEVFSKSEENLAQLDEVKSITKSDVQKAVRGAKGKVPIGREYILNTDSNSSVAPMVNQMKSALTKSNVTDAKLGKGFEVKTKKGSVLIKPEVAELYLKSRDALPRPIQKNMDMIAEKDVDGLFQMLNDAMNDLLKGKIESYIEENESVNEDAKMGKQSDSQLKTLIKNLRTLEKKDPKAPSTKSMIKRVEKEMKKRKLEEYKILSKTPRKDASPIDKQIRAGVKFNKARIMTHKGEVELTKKEMQAWLKSYDKLLPRLKDSMNAMAIRGPEGLRLTIKAGIHDFGPAIKAFPKEFKELFQHLEDNTMDMEESTAAYAKSLEKIANDRKMKNISKKDKETLIKIAQLMKRANEENIEEKKLDPVNPKAADKFKDRKDKDIDNDGDVDSSDKYLHKRRKAIGKAIKKEGLTPRLSAMIDGCANISDKEAFVKEFKLTEDSKYSEIYKAAKLFNK
jgi:hypothetical protein